MGIDYRIGVHRYPAFDVWFVQVKVSDVEGGQKKWKIVFKSKSRQEAERFIHDSSFARRDEKRRSKASNAGMGAG